MEYKEGDIVEISKSLQGHRFAIGEKVRIYKVIKCENQSDGIHHYIAERLETDKWRIINEEIKGC